MSPAEQLKLAQARVYELREQARGVKTQLEEAEERLSSLEATGESAWLEENLFTVTADDLGEKVADYARTHGNECLEFGKVVSTGSWRLFRKALKELVRRAESP